MNKKVGFSIIGLVCLCLLGGVFLSTDKDITVPEVISNSLKNISITEHNTNHIMPHKALYKISMVSSSSGSQIVNISGHMFFEWKPTCEAYTTDHRFNLNYEYTDSPAMRITSDFTTWEAKDGNSFNFSSRRSRDGEIYEEIRGNATRKPDGSGAAIYSLPEKLTFDLPKDFVFPMQHTKLMVEAVESADQKFINTTLFDGSDTDGPIEVNAFLGKPANALARIPTSPKLDVNLLNATAKDIQMAFFPLNDVESTAADYEMDAIFHKNSVISDMVIDYNEFSIRQTLVALEELDINLNCE